MYNENIAYLPVAESSRPLVARLIAERWYSSVIVIRGKKYDMTAAEGFFAIRGDDILGLITYELRGDTCEVLSLDSFWKGHGIGTGLLRCIIDLARARGCKRIVLITTNDNIRAIRFYQRLGFDMTQLFHDALSVSRTLKPEIPLLGELGIPLRHEIEFTLPLSVQLPETTSSEGMPDETGFWVLLDQLVSESEMVIDRPKGTVHPKYPHFVYPLDYGYLKNTSAMDGNGIDVWRGSRPQPMVDAVVCTVDRMKRDAEIKILLGCTAAEQQIICQTHNETAFMKGILILR